MSGLSQRLFDATARVEKVLWIEAMLTEMDTEHPEFSSFLENSSDEDIKRAFPEASAKLVKSLAQGTESFSEWLIMRNVKGFLVQFATPVRKYLSKNTFASGWGYYATRWVYGATLDDALKAGFEFVEDQRAKEKRVFEKKQKPGKTKKAGEA